MNFTLRFGRLGTRGSVPDIPQWEQVKNTKLSADGSGGSVPEKVFKSRSNSTSFVRREREVGIVPVKVFLSKCIICMLDWTPIIKSAGIDPEPRMTNESDQNVSKTKIATKIHTHTRTHSHIHKPTLPESELVSNSRR